MKAAVFIELGRIGLEDKTIPDVEPLAALIEVMASRMGADHVIDSSRVDPACTVARPRT